MKVFGAKRTEIYSGGIILVAANSLEDAILAVSKDTKVSWMFSWWDIELKEHVGDLKYMKSYYYPLENWEEIKHLTWDGDEPTIIIEDGYSNKNKPVRVFVVS